jgi:enoyl-CoA hydratase/carnithine racemase
MVDLSQHGSVWVLRMDDEENRFHRSSIADLHAALDTIEAVEGDRALVTTGTGKYYSNGLDLDWLMAGEGTDGFIEEVHRLFGRVLGFPAFTVAAVNGHAFAGGAMLACAHDKIVMRADRGYWCLPEVDLGLPLTPAMYATVAAHLPGETLADAVLTGRRYGGFDAVEAGIAIDAVAEDEVLTRAVSLAAEMAAKDRTVLAAHKALLYGDALRTCGL